LALSLGNALVGEGEAKLLWSAQVVIVPWHELGQLIRQTPELPVEIV
jgi:hypothetical protein